MPETTPLLIAVLWGPPIVIALLVGFGLRRPSDRQVGAFAKAYDVPLTEETAELIRTNVRRIRRWRYAGAFVSVIVVTTVSLAAREETGFGTVLATCAFGFAIGCVIGEFRRPRRPGSRVAGAWPEKRRLRHYVSRWASGFLVVFGFVVGVSVVGALVDRRFDLVGLEDRRDAHSTPVVIGLAVAWLVMAALTWLALRRLTMAPEPMATPEQHVVDRAIRSSAFITVIGAAVMAFGLIGMQVIWPIAVGDGSQSPVVQWFNGILNFVCVLAVPCGFLVAINSVPNLGLYIRVPRVPSGASKQTVDS